MLDKARRLGVPVLRMQSMEGATPGVLAPVDIEDLLLRPSHDVDGDLVGRFVRASAASSRAAGGSIGGEICRRLKAYDAAAILVLENSELALHSIQEDLARLDGAADVTGHIVDIREKERLAALVKPFRPAPSSTRRPEARALSREQDWPEGVKTNISARSTWRKPPSPPRPRRW